MQADGSPQSGEPSQINCQRCKRAKLPTKGEGQADVRSSSEHSDSLTPVARKKLQGLQAEGFIVNGVAIFNPATGQRGLVDYLGYVGGQTSEKPSNGEELWCLHILGPDDVHAAPSKEHAERAAERFNEIHGPVAASAGVMCRAVAAPTSCCPPRARGE